jgi:hypothetical protein
VAGADAERGEVTTFEHLQEMTPQQRREHFRASIVWDLDDLTATERALLEQQRHRVIAREERLRGQAS